MALIDYETINKANWNERAPEHVRAPHYIYHKLMATPDLLSDVVTFDIPLMGDITGLDVVHLQCHIGTDTLSLARRGAKGVVGLDFSPVSLEAAKELASKAHGGDRLRFVEASVYDAGKLLASESFDLVFTGIGALCWLPDIRRWAKTVASLLRPGGRLFIREGHPVLWAIDQAIRDNLVIGYPYFECEQPVVTEQNYTYVKLQDAKVFKANQVVEWNHGLGEIIQALIDAGMSITILKEHTSVPWEALPGQMVDAPHGEFALASAPERMPLTYTLQAIKLSKG